MTSYIEAEFPNLRTTGFAVVGPTTPGYNCIAWAAGDTQRWWWPDDQGMYYWPKGVPRAETVESFIQAFQLLGYEPCDNSEYEPGFEKVAIYTDASGAPTHMARQLDSGAWTSKLGSEHDIDHPTLHGLEGTYYGSVALMMKRRSGVANQNAVTTQA
jgi:hypothetical protein